jgi:hypothetical protein
MDPIGSKIDYFIVCHDQDIINQQINKNIFRNLPSYKFLFVGNGKTSKLNHLDHETIICRNLKYNLEEYPYLCSFVAWYAVVKNSLYQNKNICLLEYDIELDTKFHQINAGLINKYNKNNYIIGYNKTLTDHYVFYKSTPWLAISLKKIYNIDLQQFVDANKHQYKFWPTTTNITLSKQILNKFVDWFLPMTEVFRHDPFGAYVHERAFFIFCILNQLNIKYASNTLEHKQLASHGISDFYGSFLHSKNSHQLHHYMLKEYDELYENLERRCKEEN